MSASSKMAKDPDEANSESSWSALAKGKERGWWSIDPEGEEEKLEVRGPWSVTEGDSVDPKEEVAPQVRSHKGSKRGRGKVEG